MTRLRNLLAALAMLIGACGPVGAQPVIAKIAANPALWVVRTRTATAYLLGAIHVLPANVEWRTPAIVAAMARADTFVFEAPLDDSGQASSRDFIRDHGTLPADVALPSLLDAGMLQDYRKALSLTHVPADSLDHIRPWLAGVMLEVAFIRAEHYSPDSGVDRQVFAWARSHGRFVRTFESVGQQLSLLMPDDPKLELAEFDTELKELQTDANALGPLVDAWSHGNSAEVGRLVNADLAGDTQARKALLDDRNAAWLNQLRTMLAEPHTYFITVGAGHLAGPHGLPALLRKAGYAVESP